MAGKYMNRATVVGYLGRDPEIRARPDGTMMAVLHIATSHSWIDRKTGERKKETDWHRAAVHAPALVSIAEKHLLRGSRVLAEGRLKTRSWDDAAKVRHYRTEIILEGPAARLERMEKHHIRHAGDDGDTDNAPEAEAERSGASEGAIGGQVAEGMCRRINRQALALKVAEDRLVQLAACDSAERRAVMLQEAKAVLLSIVAGNADDGS